MARSLRQSKILELISTKEIETQDDLVTSLKNAGFDVTQATISRDIKELGLIKVIGSNGKYKYAIVESNEQGVSNKIINLFKTCVISIKVVGTSCIVRTVKQFANGVCSIIDRLNLVEVVGCTYGDDTVVILFLDEAKAKNAQKAMLDILE